LVDVKTWTVQLASLNSLNVTVPVGAFPPTRMASSRSVLLIRATWGLAVVVRTGDAAAAACTAAGHAPVQGPAAAVADRGTTEEPP
jgi:hypothetical protein